MIRKSLVALFAGLFLVGCIDSDSGSSSSDANVSEVAGLWRVDYTENGETYTGSMVITSDGRAFINDLDSAIYGSARVRNGNLSITGHYYSNNVYSVNITGRADSDRMEMTGSTAAGNQDFVMSRTQQEKDLYNQGSDIEGLAGSYSRDPDSSYDAVPGTTSIDSLGGFTFSGPGCSITGQLGTINTEFNEYTIELDTASCSAFPSGVYEGVAVEYKNSEDRQGLFATAVLGTTEAIWFMGVK